MGRERLKKKDTICYERGRENVLPKMSMLQVLCNFLKWEALQLYKKGITKKVISYLRSLNILDKFSLRYKVRKLRYDSKLETVENRN